MPHRRYRRLPLLAALLSLSACSSNGEKHWYWPFGPSSSEKAAKLVPAYQDKLDVHTTITYTTHPVAHVTVTNIGNRDVDYLRFVAVADSAIPGTDYHDVRVLKPLTGPSGEQTLLPRDGGTTTFLVEFKDWPTPVPNSFHLEVTVSLRLTEIGFR